MTKAQLARLVKPQIELRKKKMDSIWLTELVCEAVRTIELFLKTPVQVLKCLKRFGYFLRFGSRFHSSLCNDTHPTIPCA